MYAVRLIYRIGEFRTESIFHFEELPEIGAEIEFAPGIHVRIDLIDVAAKMPYDAVAYTSTLQDGHVISTEEPEQIVLAAADYGYAHLIGMDLRVDANRYRLKYDSAPKSSAGIPLAAEAEVEKRGRIFAEIYERLYADSKNKMNRAGLSFIQPFPQDGGGVLCTDLAALVPSFVQSLERRDGEFFAVAVLHWMRANEDNEWIFSHLCEAVFRFFNINSVRAPVGETQRDAFDDLRDYLREALYQYAHRYC